MTLGSKTSTFQIFCVAFLFSAIWHYFIFGYTFFLDFSKDDGYYWWSYQNRFQFVQHWQHNYWIQIGRYGSWFIWKILSLPINNISDLFWIRIVSLIGSSLAMTMLFLSFRRSGITTFLSIIISALIFTLPAVGLNFTYELGAPSVFAWNLSILAFLILYYQFEGLIYPQKFKISLSILNNKKKLVLLMTSFLCLLCSVAIYQMAVFFFLIAYCAAIFFDEKQIQNLSGNFYLRLLKLCFPLIFLGIAIIFYFVLHKFVLVPTITKMDPNFFSYDGDIYSFSITGDWGAKYTFIFSSLLPSALSLWDLFQTNWSASISLVLLSLGYLVICIQHYNKQSEESKVEVINKIKIINLKFLLAILLIFFAAAPLILAKGNHFSYRVIFVMSAIIIVVLAWIAKKTFAMTGGYLRTVSLITFFTVFCLITLGTQQRIISTVRAENLELEIVRMQVRQHFRQSNSLSHVYLIPAISGKNSLGRRCSRSKEYYCPSSDEPNHFLWAIAGVIREEVSYGNKIVFHTGVPPEGDSKLPSLNQVWLLHNNQKITKPEGESVLVIDMPSLIKDRDQKLSSMNLAEISSDGGHSVQPYGAALAFDGSIEHNNFWEISGIFPFNLTLFFDQRKVFSRYDFYSVESPERMPKDWLLQASIDGKAWVTLDQRVNQPVWRNNEKRSYILSDVSSHKFFRWAFASSYNPAILRIYEISLVP